MGLTVRPYVEADRDALVAIVEARGAELFPDPNDHDVHCVLVAERDGRVVGFIAGQAQLEVHVALAPSESSFTKGRAVKALISGIVEESRAKGFRRCVAGVMPWAKKWADQLIRIGIPFDARYHFEVNNG